MNTKVVKAVATKTLDAFEAISTTANVAAHGPVTSPLSALASVNVLTADAVSRSHRASALDELEAMAALAREPAIHEVIAEEGGVETTYYICRGKTYGIAIPGAKIVSAGLPLGHIASFDAGDEVEIDTPNGERLLVIKEVARLRPSLKVGGWDSVNSTISGTKATGLLTIKSFRALLDQPKVTKPIIDVVGSILAAERQAQNVVQGRQRQTFEKMALRDQPILDRYQSEIFRLPLGRQLLIVGAPGTGKTTNFIRRLGQKLDIELISAGERRTVEAQWANELPTPTVG